jgi:hypothetical protein
VCQGVTLDTIIKRPLRLAVRTLPSQGGDASSILVGATSLKEYIMPNMILAKNGQRFSHFEWISLDSSEKDMLLSKYGPAYTEEAWRKHHSFGKLRK